MADPITRAGGLLPWAENEKATSLGLRRMGSLVLQTVFATWSRMFRTNVTTDPQSRVWGASDFLVVMTGNLTLNVAPGVGFIYKAADDEYSPDYQEIVLGSTTGLTLGTHDPANPRIDRIVVTTATADELSESHSVRDPVSGTLTATPEYTRRRIACLLSVVAGTPGASPSAPATPANSISLATIAVPAASGAGVATDTRVVMQFAIARTYGDLEVNGDVGFGATVEFQDEIDIYALTRALAASGVQTAGTGTWSVVNAGGSGTGMDGGGITRPHLLLTTPAVNDEINIDIGACIRPGCALSGIIVLAEADTGTVTLDGRLQTQPWEGTSNTKTALASTNASAVADAGRHMTSLFFADPTLTVVHGSSAASSAGKLFYGTRLRVTAVGGGAARFAIYGVVLLWTSTALHAALGRSSR